MPTKSGKPMFGSRKADRAYEHIKAGYVRKGRSLKTAKRLAAMTVNSGRKRKR